MCLRASPRLDLIKQSYQNSSRKSNSEKKPRLFFRPEYQDVKFTFGQRDQGVPLGVGQCSLSHTRKGSVSGLSPASYQKLIPCLVVAYFQSSCGLLPECISVSRFPFLIQIQSYWIRGLLQCDLILINYSSNNPISE